MKTIEGFRLRRVMGQATVIGEGIAQVDFDKLITLNASAAYLWEAVEGREFTVDDLARLLVERYGILPETALSDASNIARQWMKYGIASEGNDALTR